MLVGVSGMGLLHEFGVGVSSFAYLTNGWWLVVERRKPSPPAWAGMEGVEGDKSQLPGTPPHTHIHTATNMGVCTRSVGRCHTQMAFVTLLCQSLCRFQILKVSV